MKKILLSTLILTAFGFSLILIQVGCKKDAIAAQIASYVLPIATTTSLGGVMVDGTTIIIDKEGKISTVPIVVVGPVPETVEFSEIIYVKEEGANGSPEFWKVNMNGTGNQRIPIVVPANLEIEYNEISFKRTTTKLIFCLRGDNDHNYIYTCNLDGSALKRIVQVDDDFSL
ncbi:MAG: hypothetical protein EOO20_11095 [Chryseobacterium sp.]|nr:MAG: hypothetical protein EOO20_11095 [Chryseobacterium sp.]